jgi:hypothetical protein
VPTRAKQIYTEGGSVYIRRYWSVIQCARVAKQSYTERGSVSRRNDSAVSLRTNESETELGVQKEWIGNVSTCQ